MGFLLYLVLFIWNTEFTDFTVFIEYTDRVLYLEYRVIVVISNFMKRVRQAYLVDL